MPVALVHLGGGLGAPVPLDQIPLTEDLSVHPALHPPQAVVHDAVPHKGADNNADAVNDTGVGHTFGGDAAGLLGGSGQALLPQPLDGLVHVAVGGGQGLFTIHHTGPGHLSQFFYLVYSLLAFLRRQAPPLYFHW